MECVMATPNVYRITGSFFVSCSQASSRAAQKRLKEGMVFVFDGFHAWTLETGGTKTISVEEMVVITENGAEYLIAPQEELVLVG